MQITKKELQELYKLPNKKVCEKLGITEPTLVSYLDKFGIKRKGKGNRPPKQKIKLVK